MAEIVLFHSALGLRPGVHADAERLRAAGHVVHTPDFYDGHVFDDLDDGMAYVNQIGFAAAFQRGTDLASALPAAVVYAGYSLGGAIAEDLAISRPGALGALLLHNAQPVEGFERAEWPASVPAQVHYAIDDPWMEADEVVGLIADLERAGAPFEIFTYPGDAHLFTDAGLAEYDADAAALVWSRALGFLAALGR